MTTAHRPTWKAAVGRAQEGGWGAGGAPSAASSVLDVASHTKLKLRAGSQVVPEDKKALLQASLAKLEEAERGAAVRSGGVGGRGGVLNGAGLIKKEVEEEGRRRLLKQTAEVDEVGIKSKYDDADDDDDDGGGSGGWSDLDDDDRGEKVNDDDSDLDASDSDSDDDDDDDSDDDEDEEAALQAELAKIRAEREAAKMREEAEAAAEEEARLEEAALTGNPLLSSSAEASSSGRLKRRWNDDVVFRNQAKNEPDQSRKRFINDTVRNDFHKRFLNKFIR